MPMTVINAETGINQVQNNAVDLGTDVTGTLPLNNMTIAGSVIQVANFTTGAVVTSTTPIPNDDTIPQISEGGLLMSLAFTPKKANSLLMIDVIVQTTSNGNYHNAIALFNDSNVNAIGSCQSTISSGYKYTQSLKVFVSAVNTTTKSFTVRGGTDIAGTLTMNGSGAGARLLGGSLASSITITEIAQ